MRRLTLILLLAVPWGFAQAQEAVDFSMLPAVEMRNPTGETLLDITRAGDRLVAVGESGLIVLSDDDGASWTQAEVPVSVTLTSIYFRTPKIGWAGGHQGVILQTINGGDSWSMQIHGSEIQQQVLSGAQKTIDEINASLDSITDEYEKDDAIYMAEELGFLIEDTTEALPQGPSEPVLDLWVDSNGKGFAVGAYGMLLQTSNDGKDWTLHPSYFRDLDRLHYYSILSIDNETLMLSGEQGMLRHSFDGGKTWERSDSPYDGSLFGSLNVNGKVMVYGLQGRIFISEDKGLNWTPFSNPSSAAILGGYVGKDGKVNLFCNNGDHLVVDIAWSRLKSTTLPSQAPLSAAVEKSNGSLIIVGQTGIQ